MAEKTKEAARRLPRATAEQSEGILSLREHISLMQKTCASALETYNAIPKGEPTRPLLGKKISELAAEIGSETSELQARVKQVVESAPEFRMDFDKCGKQAAQGLLEFWSAYYDYAGAPWRLAVLNRTLGNYDDAKRWAEIYQGMIAKTSALTDVQRNGMLLVLDGFIQDMETERGKSPAAEAIDNARKSIELARFLQGSQDTPKEGKWARVADLDEQKRRAGKQGKQGKRRSDDEDRSYS